MQNCSYSSILFSSKSKYNNNKKKKKISVPCIFLCFSWLYSSYNIASVEVQFKMYYLDLNFGTLYSKIHL